MKPGRAQHRYNLRGNKKHTTAEQDSSYSYLKGASQRRGYVVRETHHHKIVDEIHVIAASLTNQSKEHLYMLVEQHLTWMGGRPFPVSAIGQSLLRNGKFIVALSHILLHDSAAQELELLEYIEKTLVKGVIEHQMELNQYLKSKNAKKSKRVEAKRSCRSKTEPSRCGRTVNQQQCSNQSKIEDDLKVVLQTEESESPYSSAGVYSPRLSAEPADDFHSELMKSLAVKRLQELPDILIEGVLEYDYAGLGLYSVLLVQNKRLLTALDREHVAVLPIQHTHNDPMVLQLLSDRYEISAVIRSKEAITNIKQYWQDHLDDFFRS